MNPNEYRQWLDRAFLYVEGTLLKRSAHDSPTNIVEEHIRTALIEGLRVAKHQRTADVKSETDTPWNLAADINDSSRPFGRGRSKQHDVSVEEGDVVKAVVEVK